MPPGFPTCSHRKLLKIIEKHCTLVRQTNGSHARWRSNITGKTFTFATRGKDYKTATVRKILTADVGLSLEEARKEVA